MKSKKTGRRTELNPQLAKSLCQLLSDGNTINTACGACGISERTFYNWMERGEEEKRGLFFQFFQSVTRARATAKIKLVKVVTTAAVKDWRAAAFLLERSWPKDYGRRAPEEIDALEKACPPSSAITAQQPPPIIKLSVQQDDESQLAVLIMQETGKPGGGDAEKIRRWQQTLHELTKCAELPEDEIIELDDPRNPHYQAPPKADRGNGE